MSQEATFSMGEKTLFPTDDPDFISFEYGAPGSQLLPTQIWKTAFDNWLKNDPESYLQYGPCLGDIRYRIELAKFLSRHYESQVLYERLCLTNGASQSFSNIIALFTVPNTTRVIIENPTYFLAIRVLEDHAIDRKSTLKVPVDEHGMRIDALKKILEDNPPPQMPPSIKGEKRFPYLLFLVPTYSNPSGTTLSEDRRKELMRNHLSEFIILTETSFSKILAPGSRLGWVEAGPGIIAQYEKSGLMYSGGSPNHFFSGVATSALRLGLIDTHLYNLRETYKARMDIMCDFLQREMPPSVKFSKPKGGFFVWIELPKTINTTELLDAIKSGRTYKGIEIPKQKISFAPGNAFSSDGNHGNFMRLTYSFYEPQDLLKGLNRLKIALDCVLKS
ncbi:pyridoxal phosphate-dependent transferase [Chytridium lagenaria]|nr:pyridoxal phosphate-dependent transferase [Chytridium lagenaria]